MNLVLPVLLSEISKDTKERVVQKMKIKRRQELWLPLETVRNSDHKLGGGRRT
jgi:hypothetical protein